MAPRVGRGGVTPATRGPSLPSMHTRRPALRGLLARTVATAAQALPATVVRRGLIAASRAGRGLPVGPPDAARVLVVAPHPDDETLAVGGTTHRLADLGATVDLVLATAGEASLAGGTPEVLARQRTADARAAAAVLGVREVVELRLPDGHLAEHVEELADHLDRLLTDGDHEVVLTTWYGDDHPDHRAVGRALASLPARHGHVAVWGGEMWTPAPATNLVDLRPADVEAKARAVALHRTVARTFDLSARLALDRYRSVNGLAGRGSAEAFVVTSIADLGRAIGEL